MMSSLDHVLIVVIPELKTDLQSRSIKIHVRKGIEVYGKFALLNDDEVWTTQNDSR